MLKTLATAVAIFGIAAPALNAQNTIPDKLPQAEWTVMVFLNAKNDLEGDGLADMNEMEKVGSGNGLNIVVELGRSRDMDLQEYRYPKDRWSGVRRYYISKDNDNFSISSTMMENRGNANMGSAAELANFVQWSKYHFPAKRYMLVMWNHGSGWTGISYDSDADTHINLQQLKNVLEAAGKFDVIITDACLMQGIEVVYELRDTAEIIVGSEDTIPVAGYDYTMLSLLKSKPSSSPEEIAKAAVASFSAYYRKLHKNTTNSAVRTAILPYFVQLVNEWLQMAQTKEDLLNGVSLSLKSNLYRFGSRGKYVDLVDYIYMVSMKSNKPALMSKANQILRLVQDRKDGVLVARDYSGKYVLSSGFSVYMPIPVFMSFNTDYLNLSFAKDSLWDEYYWKLFPSQKILSKRTNNNPTRGESRQ